MKIHTLAQIGIGILLSVGISFGVHSYDISAREEASAQLAALKSGCDSLGIDVDVFTSYVSKDTCVLWFKSTGRVYSIKPAEFDTIRAAYKQGKLSHDCKRTN
jgi:ActR/RegA family two-component response regulator